MTNNEEQKSVIDKMLSKIGLTTIKLEAEKVALEQMKLDDGTTTIEADSFEAGQPVMIVTEDEQMIPLPVGEYVLEDGRILVVQEEGVIAEIKDAQTENAAPMEEAPVAQSEAPTAAPVAKKVVESVSKESYFSADMQIPDVLLEAIAKVVDERMNANKVEEVTEEVELSNVKPIVHNPERVSLASKLNQEGGLTSFLNNIK